MNRNTLVVLTGLGSMLFSVDSPALWRKIMKFAGPQQVVSDNPPPALIDSMAQTFTRTDGDLRAVLTAMFHSPAFWSRDPYGAKVKTPLESWWLAPFA